MNGAGYQILQAEKDGLFLLKFVGEIRLNLCSTIDRAVEAIEQNPDLVTVVLDLSQASIVDSTTLGLIARIGLSASESGKIMPTIVSTNPDVTRMIESMGMDDLFVIVQAPAIQASDLRELPILKASEAEVQEKVLAAHRTLTELNETNREAFRDLITALECQ